MTSPHMTEERHANCCTATRCPTSDSHGASVGVCRRKSRFHNFSWADAANAIAVRGQVGVVHERWGGKLFRDGEVSSGADFDDWDLTAMYIGGKARFLPSYRLRPFVLGNIGVARLAPLDVTVNGVETPYWSETYRDYLDLGVGVEYALTRHVAAYADARLEAFGKPGSRQPRLADATGGQTVPITLGLDYEF